MFDEVAVHAVAVFLHGRPRAIARGVRPERSDVYGVLGDTAELLEALSAASDEAEFCRRLARIAALGRDRAAVERAVPAAAVRVVHLALDGQCDLSDMFLEMGLEDMLWRHYNEVVAMLLAEAGRHAALAPLGALETVVALDPVLRSAAARPRELWFAESLAALAAAVKAHGPAPAFTISSYMRLVMRAQKRCSAQEVCRALDASATDVARVRMIVSAMSLQAWNFPGLVELYEKEYADDVKAAADAARDVREGRARADAVYVVSSKRARAASRGKLLHFLNGTRMALMYLENCSDLGAADARIVARACEALHENCARITAVIRRARIEVPSAINGNVIWRVRSDLPLLRGPAYVRPITDATRGTLKG